MWGLHVSKYFLEDKYVLIKKGKTVTLQWRMLPDIRFTKGAGQHHQQEDVLTSWTPVCDTWRAQRCFGGGVVQKAHCFMPITGKIKQMQAEELSTK